MTFENIIVMKYGVHASELVESIILRKKQELINANKMYWGYGGVLCHPMKQVRPFLDQNNEINSRTYLLLAKTKSDFNNEAKIATEFAYDGVNWMPIEEGIEIRGSKYALVCKSLEEVNFELDLAEYKVAIGNSEGKPLVEYLRGRVDKACARKSGTGYSSKLINITYVAEVTSAVYVR